MFCEPLNLFERAGPKRTQLAVVDESTSWTVGQQTILLGDCLAVLREVASGSVDVIVTSPP